MPSNPEDLAIPVEVRHFRAPAVNGRDGSRGSLAISDGRTSGGAACCSSRRPVVALFPGAVARDSLPERHRLGAGQTVKGGCTCDLKSSYGAERNADTSRRFSQPRPIRPKPTCQSRAAPYRRVEAKQRFATRLSITDTLHLASCCTTPSNKGDQYHAHKWQQHQRPRARQQHQATRHRPSDPHLQLPPTPTRGRVALVPLDHHLLMYVDIETHSLSAAY